jgi:hypothetical protein
VRSDARSARELAVAQGLRHGRTREDETTMKDDLILVTGVAVAAAACVWYVAHAVAGVVHPIPTDEMCSSATQCLALALGQ